MNEKMVKTRFHLPTAEDDLWEQVVLALLKQRDGDEERAKNHLRLLEELAFHHRFCGKALTYSFVENTATWLIDDEGFDRLTPRKTAQAWLAKLVDKWDLLEREGNGVNAPYKFAIDGLDEYFAARHLAARWAEGDEKYREWLPCMESWWERGKELLCLNPYCRAILRRFRDLVVRSENEETILLTVGLLRDVERENMFLNGISYSFTLTLKAVSRCRHAHHGALRSAVWDALTPAWSSIDVTEAFVAAGRARLHANLDAVLQGFLYIMHFGGMARWKASSVVPLVGRAVVNSLIPLLSDNDPDVRQASASALGDIADPRAVEPLIALLKDKNPRVRFSAAHALSQIGDTQAVEPLMLLLNDGDWDVRISAAHALGKIADARAVPALESVLDDPFFRVRDYARWALKQIECRGSTQSS